jgi:AcrR family transcriptional regulator
LIAAAKAVIAARGYEGATPREIAAFASMPTGAVFANFTGRADLFHEMIVADHAMLLQRMKVVAQARAAPHETLLNMLMLGYEMSLERRSLAKAETVFAWLVAPDQRGRDSIRSIVACLTEELGRALCAGRLPPSLDCELVAQMAWDSYVANYNHVIFDGWTLEQLRSRLSAQINCLAPTGSVRGQGGRPFVRGPGINPGPQRSTSRT